MSGPFVTLAGFDDQYRRDVCKIGQGADCCRYLTMGGDGFSCAKQSSMAWSIDNRVEQMTAKADNCGGAFDPLPAFVLLRDRFEVKAGATIYRAKAVQP